MKTSSLIFNSWTQRKCSKWCSIQSFFRLCLARIIKSAPRNKEKATSSQNWTMNKWLVPTLGHLIRRTAKRQKRKHNMRSTRERTWILKTSLRWITAKWRLSNRSPPPRWATTRLRTKNSATWYRVPWTRRLSAKSHSYLTVISSAVSPVALKPRTILTKNFPWATEQ